jgi:hypothetical protein
VLQLKIPVWRKDVFFKNRPRLWYCPLRVCYVKGTVSRDFSSRFFYYQQTTSLGLSGYFHKRFRFFQIFVEFSVFVIDYPVINTPGSRLLSVFGKSIRTGLQANFLVTNRTGSKGPKCINDMGVMDSLVYFSSVGFFTNQFRSNPWWWIHRSVN